MDTTQKTLREYVITVLFKDDKFNKRVIDWRSNPAEAKVRILEEASSWTPQSQSGNTLIGRLFGLHTEITVEQGKVTKVYVEID